VLPGATVRLINGAIGFSQIQVTVSDGLYTFNNVPPAEDYLISVEKTGFATQVRSDLNVHVYDDLLLQPPFLLQPNLQANPPVAPETPTQAAPQASSQPSQPASQPPAPQTLAMTPQQSSKSPSISLDLLSMTESGVLDTQRVHTLPLLNRDFIDLAELVPGAYPVEQGSVLQGASLVVNGTRADMNNFLLDGADNNDYTINQSLPFQIVEALQEFRVQTSTSTAEFGRSAGAQINSVSRSGSNSLHGELFEFNRNSALGARNFFSAYNGGTFDQYSLELQLRGNGNPLSDPTLAQLYDVHKPQVSQNQFGGSVGGPLIKDKIFGFFNWESSRLTNPRPLFEQVPGTTLRSATDCANARVSTRAPSPIPPGAACDPMAIRLFSLYPLPNVPTTQFTDPSASNLFGAGAFNVGQAANNTNSDNFLARVDWRKSQRVSMSFRYNIQLIHQVQGGDVPATESYTGNGTRVTGRNQNASYNYVQQFTPATGNEFRFGWNRLRLTTTALDASIDPATLGFQNLNSHNAGLPTILTGGYFTVAPFSSLGAIEATPSNRADNVWSVADNLVMTRGRHNWRFGGEFRYVRLNIDNSALGRGVVGLFSGPFAAASGTADIASIARVCPQSLPQFTAVFAVPCERFGTGFDRSFSTKSGAVFVQDQWRVFHNLTLNYGLRYEVNSAPVERRDRLVNFYPDLGTNGALVRGGSATEFDPYGNVIGTAPHSVPRAGYNTDYGGWGPRFGFAWDPRSDGKTVLRGGYALLFDQQPLEPSVNQLVNPPFIQQSFSLGPLLSDTFSACGPGITDNGCLSVSGNANSTSAWFLVPYSITAIDRRNKTPYVHQFHFGVQQQLGGNAVVEVAYAGSAGHRLPLLRDISQCPQSAFLANPLACIFSTNSFAHLSILDQDNVANSIFNSLQVRVATRSFHGLEFHAFYQLAKSIDDASSLQPQVFLASPQFASLAVALLADSPYDFVEANNISPALSTQGNLPLVTTRPRLPQDSGNLAAERGRSDFDMRHRFVVDYVYTIPRWAPVIGSGWQVAGITTVQSGQPFTVYSDYFGIPLRPNTREPVPTNMNNPEAAIDGGTAFGFPGSSFDLTPTFQLQPGSLGRNAFTGPKFINFDFSVMKDTHLTERTNLQFRAEFFNLFNNANFHQPYSRTSIFFGALPGFAQIIPGLCRVTNGARLGTCYLPDPFFGKILQAFSARQVQFALKLVF
jgi:hypothetical protein